MMTLSVAELVEASQSLSVADRKTLAEAIRESIPLDDGGRPSEAALAEIRRRRDEYDASPESGIPTEEMWARLDSLRTC